MLDLTRSDPVLLRLIDTVATELLTKSTKLEADDIMVVGARCRDILQRAFGHEFTLRATTDIDLGLAVANWNAYDELADALPPTGDTGIRFRVANAAADLLPFGGVEDPPGSVTPPARGESLSVWGFAEVFAAALNLELPSARTIRIPTPAGYAALKLAAWLDRSAYGKYDDASDIATVIYWYSRSQEVLDLVYESDHGQDLLIQESLDDTRATARVLGEKIAATIGTDRLVELAERWPTSRKDLLYRYMTVTNSPDWAGTSERRRELIQALERGMGVGPDS